MTVPSAAKPPQAAKIDVLRCQSPTCGALLAYEVDAEGFLYLDLAWMARRTDGIAYFPCPRCGGRNIVERAADSKGRLRPRVVAGDR